MNVLILTPDRVGSTLLQRLLTVYMLRAGFDKPVINLHELTNGLVKYHNETLNQEVLGKSQGTEWGYFQTLSEIQELLMSSDHYKTSRLAHYHIVNRKDSIADQLKFYDYLNKNFYIIGCRRENLLEHALSWAINGHSKKLNVYSPREKINVFQDIYSNGIECSEQSLKKYLTNYKEYISWSDTYFNIQSYFNYEQAITNVEDYILNLDFMKGATNNRWSDMFGQSFDTYNKCHKLIPDLALYNVLNSADLAIHLIEEEKYNLLKGTQWPKLADLSADKLNSLPYEIREEIKNNFSIEVGESQQKLTTEIAEFVSVNLPAYKNTTNEIDNLVSTGFLVSPIPIKLQTFKEKKQLIKNFTQCVEWYNNWVSDNNFGKLYSENDIDQTSLLENSKFTQVSEEFRLLF